MGPNAACTACRITIPKMVITRAMNVTEVKCAWKAGKGEAVDFQPRTSCLRLSDNFHSFLSFIDVMKLKYFE